MTGTGVTDSIRMQCPGCKTWNLFDSAERDCEQPILNVQYALRFDGSDLRPGEYCISGGDSRIPYGIDIFFEAVCPSCNTRFDLIQTYCPSEWFVSSGLDDIDYRHSEELFSPLRNKKSKESLGKEERI